MDDETRERIMFSGIEMFDSLYKAIDEAGGAISTSPKELAKLPVSRLFGMFATNDIRFCYVGKTPSAKKKTKTAERKASKPLVEISKIIVETVLKEVKMEDSTALMDLVWDVEDILHEFL